MVQVGRAGAPAAELGVPLTEVGALSVDGVDALVATAVGAVSGGQAGPG